MAAGCKKGFGQLSDAKTMAIITKISFSFSYSFNFLALEREMFTLPFLSPFRSGRSFITIPERAGAIEYDMDSGGSLEASSRPLTRGLPCVSFSILIITIKYAVSLYMMNSDIDWSQFIVEWGDCPFPPPPLGEERKCSEAPPLRSNVATGPWCPMSAFSWDTDLRQSSRMNGPTPPQPAARPRSGGGHLAHASTGSEAISPKSVKAKIRTPIKRKHEQQEQESSSADSADDAAGGRAGKGRQPGVKRACNECRQQKVSHIPTGRQNTQPQRQRLITCCTAEMRRGVRAFISAMCPLPAIAPVMQNRLQLQTDWEEKSTYGDGKRACRAEGPGP